MNTKIICCVAGKSGGHIIPCLTIAQKKQAHILFFSSNTPLDRAILSQDPRVSWHIMLLLSTRAQSLLRTMWQAISSFFVSFFYLCKHRPEEIITTGGIVAIPTCIAGFILRIPITLYSLDAVPGKAIRFLTPFATSIITPFTASQKYFPARKCRIESYPVKYESMTTIPDQGTALHSMGLSPHKKTILVLGGSQGSLFLNNCMKIFVESSYFDCNAIQIIHQTGSLDATDWKEFYTEKNVTAHVFSYTPHLENIYAAADLIICRAGAGTLFEIKFFNKKCIVIPLETNTTTHQIDNAWAMSSEYPELFCMVMQKDIEKDPTTFFAMVKQFLHLSHSS